MFDRIVSDEQQATSHGTGPLLQRDYWAVITGTDLKPSAVMSYVKAHFCELPPTALVEFVAPAGVTVGATLDIRIKPAQQCQVRVVDMNAQSITLATLQGHPEAGRITFGSYRNCRGEVLFHIRSRARAASASTLIGFLTIGEAMQTNTWTDFINNLAHAIGGSIAGPIRADTIHDEEGPDDRDPRGVPTFLAVGD